jgi:hypothetical protein
METADRVDQAEQAKEDAAAARLTKFISGHLQKKPEFGGLNLANLSDEQQIEAEDDYPICVRHGSEQEAKPKKRQPKILPDDDE